MRGVEEWGRGEREGVSMFKLRSVYSRSQIWLVEDVPHELCV